WPALLISGASGCIRTINKPPLGAVNLGTSPTCSTAQGLVSRDASPWQLNLIVAGSLACPRMTSRHTPFSAIDSERSRPKELPAVTVSPGDTNACGEIKTWRELSPDANW